MKAKLYLFIALAIITSIGIKAQTTNYDVNGQFIGTPITSSDPFEVNFFYWMETDLPTNPGISTFTEKGMIAYRNCFIINGAVSTASNLAPPNIVFPTFANGIDRIEVEFAYSNPTASIYLHYWNAALPTPAFGWKQSLGPAIAPSTTVFYTVNANLQLGLLQRGGTWTAIQRITIYPKVPSGISDIKEEDAFLTGNTLKLKDMASQINFYSFTGVLLYSAKNISGQVILPTSKGIVEVTMNDKILKFKKL